MITVPSIVNNNSNIENVENWTQWKGLKTSKYRWMDVSPTFKAQVNL